MPLSRKCMYFRERRRSVSCFLNDPRLFNGHPSALQASPKLDEAKLSDFHRGGEGQRSMKATYFVSDLHLFSKRSREEMYHVSLQHALQRAGCFVLGGDIFDFRWSTLPSFQASLNAAEEWVEQLVQPRPECEFHYVLGNHDSHPQFVERLQNLARRLPNLKWHHEYLRRGEDVFLHGDVLDGETTSNGLSLRRQRWADEKRKGPVSNALYDAAIAVRAHKMVGQLAHPRERTARKLLDYLHHVGQGPDSGLQRVYFGHTHAAWNAFRYSGVSFHNGGAPMTGLQFRVLEVGDSPVSSPSHYQYPPDPRLSARGGWRANVGERIRKLPVFPQLIRRQKRRP